jgi:hypothetical protein
VVEAAGVAPRAASQKMSLEAWTRRRQIDEQSKEIWSTLRFDRCSYPHTYPNGKLGLSRIILSTSRHTIRG